MGREFQTVCHWPTLLKNGKRPNIARCELSFDPEPLDPLHWRYPQINLIPHLEGDSLPLFVRITLLAGLSRFQIFLYELNLLLSFLNYIKLYQAQRNFSP